MGIKTSLVLLMVASQTMGALTLSNLSVSQREGTMLVELKQAVHAAMI